MRNGSRPGGLPKYREIPPRRCLVSPPSFEELLYPWRATSPKARVDSLIANLVNFLQSPVGRFSKSKLRLLSPLISGFLLKLKLRSCRIGAAKSADS
jgi:hypothetical protein